MTAQVETADTVQAKAAVDAEKPTVLSRARLRWPLSPRVMLSVTDQLLVSGMSFGTSILIGRIDATSLGVYALAMTLVHFYRSIQAEVVTAPFTVYAQQRTGDALRVYSGSVVAHQIGATVLGVLVVASSLFIAWLLGAPMYLQSALWIMIFSMPALLWHSFARQFCFARLKFAQATIIDGAVAVLQLSALAMLAWTGQMTVQRSFVVMAAAAGVGVLIWLVGRKDRFQFNRAAVTDDWRRNWGFAKWALASQLVGCSTPFVLPWAISFTRGEHDTGLFAACVTTMGLSTVFISALSNLLTPVSARRYATGGAASLLRVLWRAMMAFVAIIGTFCVVVFLTGDLLVVWFYGDAYIGTGAVCRWLAIGVLLNSISVVAGNGLWAIDQPRWNLPADLASLVVTAAAAVWFIPSVGILGAAYATVAGAGAAALIRLLTFGARIQSPKTIHNYNPRN